MLNSNTEKQQQLPPPLSPILPITNEQNYTASTSSPLSPNDQPTTHKTNTTQNNAITSWKSDTKHFRIQGWDPVLIISQILAIQAIHYLILSLMIPPLLHLFTNPIPLEYEGGTRNVAMIIDWRAMVGRTTLHIQNKDLDYQVGLAGFSKLPNSLGRKPFRIGNHLPLINLDSGKTVNASNILSSIEPSHAPTDSLLNLGLGKDWIHHNLNDASLNSLLFYDPNRSWVISFAWFITSLIEVIILYEIVRRPKQIMDHSLTISIIHMILTTYYSSRLPASIWFYFVLIFSSVVQIVLTEQLCVRREFRDGLGVGWKIDHRPDDN